MTVEATYRSMLQFSELVADAIIRRVMPQQDDLSTRAANERYGRSWMEFQKSRGRIQGHRVGKAVMYSRHELDTLREAERVNAEVINKH